MAVWLNNLDTPSLLPAIQLNAKQAFLLLPASPEHSISVNFDNCGEETGWKVKGYNRLYFEEDVILTVLSRRYNCVYTLTHSPPPNDTICRNLIYFR